MSINSRSKGATGEREFITELRKVFPEVVLERNLEQTRFGGADIYSLEPFAIEVKRCQQLSINAWRKQAVRQVTDDNPVPVLVFRQNRCPWRVQIAGTLLFKKKFGTVGWVEISLGDFVQIAKALRKGIKLS